MSERRYKKHLTPESHYEMVIRADAILNDKVVEGIENINILPVHKQIIKMFAYHGMNAYEIARTGEITGKRGNMSQDMINIWINRFFPNIKYDEKPTNCKRTHDTEHMKRCRNAKTRLMRQAPYCAVCGASENLELDHILTVSAGGNDDLSNLQLLCHSCHVAKTMQENEQFGWSKAGLAKGRVEHIRRKIQ